MENQTLSMLAGFIALVFVVISYFVKNKTLYLLFQSLCIAFLVLSYFFNVQFFAMVGIGISLCRTIVFFLYEHNGKDAPLWWPFVFSALTIASYFIINLGILGTAQPLDILCVGACILYAFVFRIRNLKVVRFTVLAPIILSILFNTLTNAALFVTISYIFELTADVVSIFKYHILGTHKEVQPQQKEKETYEKR